MGYKSEVPMTSYLDLIYLLERLTELRETIYFLDDWFTTKEQNSEAARWKRYRELGLGKRHRASLPSP